MSYFRLPQNDSTDKHLRKAVRSCLKKSPNGHHRRAGKDQSFTSKPLSNGKCYNGAEEASHIIDRSDGRENPRLARSN